MNELQCDKLWVTIKRLAKRKGPKRAAVAYVSNDDNLQFGEGDVLVTDASDRMIESGQTVAAVLERAFKRGAQIYSFAGLHAKVMLLDGTAVIGSPNLSASSEKLVEAAWVTDQPKAVAMVASMVEKLVERAKEVDEKFLGRIRRIKVVRSGWPQALPQRRKSQFNLSKPRTWIVALWPLRREYRKEQQTIARGEQLARKRLSRRSSDVSWIRWAGHSRFRSEAKRGDTVIQIWHESHERKPDAVYRHMPILVKQEEPSCTRFYIEEFSNFEKLKLSWAGFRKLAKRVGLSRIGSHSLRLISDGESEALSSLWGE